MWLTLEMQAAHSYVWRENVIFVTSSLSVISVAYRPSVYWVRHSCIHETKS